MPRGHIARISYELAGSTEPDGITADGRYTYEYQKDGTYRLVEIMGRPFKASIVNEPQQMLWELAALIVVQADPFREPGTPPG